MPGNSETNVRKKRKFKPDLGMIIFLCVFVYIVAWNLIYMSKDRISYYEVTPGEMVESDRFTAMILCSDRVENVPDAGMIYYLARSGAKVSANTPIYCLDKTRNISQIIQQSEGSEILDESKRNTIYNELELFENKYDPLRFSDVYQLKSSASSILLDALSDSMISSGNTDPSLQVIRVQEPGYIFYFSDGYEGVTPDTFSPDMLDQTKYQAQTLGNERDAAAADPAYKLITAEEWQIVFKLEEYQYDKYIEDDYVEVKFLKDGQTVWGQVSQFLEIDEEKYAVLSFTNSLVRYADARFADIEVIFSSEKGLKVPNSSIVVKNFYSIPKDYAQPDGEGIRVNMHTKNDKGEILIRSQYLEVYDETDEYYMISVNDLEEGTNIIQAETGNLYTVSDTVPVNGVYNINRGYARFNEVTILTKNDDFSIISPNDRYGLIEYDHIVLNGDLVEDEEIVYQQ